MKGWLRRHPGLKLSERRCPRLLWLQFGRLATRLVSRRSCYPLLIALLTVLLLVPPRAHTSGGDPTAHPRLVIRPKLASMRQPMQVGVGIL